METRYFHSTGDSVISAPLGPLSVTVSHGPSFEVAHVSVDLRSPQQPLSVTLKRLPGVDDWGRWWSGDLHVHMNYGGHYRDTPDRLAAQAHSEDLNLVYNLVVNKEQRVPDVASFRTDVDPASDATTMVLHGQEFHSSYWGHIGLLNLTDHLLLPGYTAYPFTAVASPFPDNGMVADLAHQQRALVGYVHPFDEDVDPVKDATLTNGLPVDAALGRVDYYEVVGFSDHKASAAIWYRLLDCGLKIPAGAGTDAMANYASLRGPVGLNRVFVPATGTIDARSLSRRRQSWPRRRHQRCPAAPRIRDRPAGRHDSSVSRSTRASIPGRAACQLSCRSSGDRLEWSGRSPPGSAIGHPRRISRRHHSGRSERLAGAPRLERRAARQRHGHLPVRHDESDLRDGGK